MTPLSLAPISYTENALMKTTREQARQLGAVVGLLSGWGLMFAFGYHGVLASAAFGIAGCLLGAITAEKIYDRNSK